MMLYLTIVILTSVLAFGCLTPALAGCARGTAGRARHDLGMAALFLVLFIPAALRVDTGNDYSRYVDLFHLIRARAYVPTEFGFNWFVRGIYALAGYEDAFLVFAVLAALTILLFLGGIAASSEDRALSVFLFVTLGYYFQSYNTVRYYLALALVFAAIRPLLEKRYLVFVLLVLLAASFHKAAVVALILYPLAVFSWKLWMLAALAAGFVLLALFPDFWMKVFVYLYPSYEGTAFLSEGTAALSQALRCALVLALGGYALRASGRDVKHSGAAGEGQCEAGDTAGSAGGADTGSADGIEAARERSFKDRALRFYLQLNVLALGTCLAGSYIPFLSRITYFLTVTQILAVPAALRRVPERIEIPRGNGRRGAGAGDAAGADAADGQDENRSIPLRRILTVAVIAMGILYFLLLLRRMDDPTLKILPYKSYLFTDRLPTVSELND